MSKIGIIPYFDAEVNVIRIRFNFSFFSISNKSKLIIHLKKYKSIKILLICSKKGITPNYWIAGTQIPQFDS